MSDSENWQPRCTDDQQPSTSASSNHSILSSNECSPEAGTAASLMPFPSSNSDAPKSPSNHHFLQNLAVSIVGFDSAETIKFTDYCHTAGAEIVDNSIKAVDYLIAAADIRSLDGIFVAARNIVNEYWLIESKRANQTMYIEYFFKPILLPDGSKPLDGTVICITGFSGPERVFLKKLSMCLGAEVTGAYVLSSEPLLISPPSADTNKFKFASERCMPIVPREWLLGCYENQKKLPVCPYLIRASTAGAGTSDVVIE